MRFVANVVRFPAVQKVWKSVKIWQSYREFKGWNFLDTQCRLLYFVECPQCSIWLEELGYLCIWLFTSCIPPTM